MKIVSVLLAMLLGLSGCSVNMVKLGVYKNKAQLIGPDGTVYVGSILINDISNDGDIDFEASPYGPLPPVPCRPLSEPLPQIHKPQQMRCCAERIRARAFYLPTARQYLIAILKLILKEMASLAASL